MRTSCPECSTAIEIADATSGSAQCPACGNIVVVASSGMAKPLSSSDAAAASDPTVTYSGPLKQVPEPQLAFGRYRVQQELGSGAFGQVFRAYDSELKRLVALKILKQERASGPAAFEQFLREAQLMASVHHPGLVAIYDVGVDHGVLYIVTQYIEGGTLHDRLVREPLTFRESAEVIRRCAEAIHVAHKAQFYHRDLKPKNILLDTAGNPFVGDFGLAIRRHEQPKHAGEFAGSMNFMSPEQLRGEAHKLDGRSDVWALGVIFYLMLTGQLPFQGIGYQVVNEILERDPLPPRQLDENIPIELARICLKALEKDISQRYQTAFDLAADLQHWISSFQSSTSDPIAPQLAFHLSKETSDFASQPTFKVAAPPPRSRRTWYISGIVALSILAVSTWMGVAGFAKREKDVAVPAVVGPVVRSGFELDTFAVPGRPYPLLELIPREIVWPKTKLTAARYFYDNQRQELAIDAPEMGLLGLGETQNGSFQFSVAFNKTNWEGSTGIFWGYQVEKSPEGKEISKCHMLRIRGVQKPGMHTRLFLCPGRLETRECDFELPCLNISDYLPADVLTRGKSPYTLEVTCLKGKVVSISWCGDDLSDVLIPTNQTSIDLLPVKGVFGVLASDCAATFSQARITVVE